MNRKILVFMVFILILNVISPIFHSSNVTAASDISSTNVTSLTVSPSQINDGGNAKVRVEFNDNNQKIHNGDTIRVNWPGTADLKIQGYSKTLPLTVHGQQVGQVVITADGATITFNENVERLQDVSGFAEFEVQGRNLTNTNKADSKTGTITSGSKNASLTVTKGEAGTAGVFYYKTGDMQPDDTQHVRWFLNINNEKKYVSKPIWVKDQIQDGQQLDLDTISITINGTHSDYFSGPNAIQQFQNKIPGASITASPDKNSIDVYIPQNYASLNNFTIAYKTKITNETQPEFVNNSQIWYQENNQPEVNGESSNHTVKNISANAGIQGTVKGELKIQKLDKDTQQPIQNVKFTLTKADGTAFDDGSKSKELVTDAQGLANIKGLPSGKYIIKEIEAPSPYVFDKNKEYPFELKDTDTQGYFIKIDNSKAAEKTKDVTAKKVWDGTKTPHPTVYFKLFQKDANNNEVAVPNADIKKLENGTTEVTWNALPELDKDGKAIAYHVKEVDAQGKDATPEGYTKKEEGLTVTNTEKPIETTSVSGKKVWDDNNDQDGKRPNSVTVNLLANGEKIKSETVTKDTNWQYEFTNLPKYDNGKAIEYTVTEDHVNDYSTTINDTTITNKYTPGKTTATVTKNWEDKNNQDGKRPGSIQVELLADGVPTNKTATLNADNEWSYTWKDLDEKSQGKAITYTVKEVSKVNGYVTSIDNSNIGNLIITNEYTPETTEVNGTKVWDDKDNQDHKRPDTVTINLLKNGEKVDAKTVDASSDWTYTFNDLPKYDNGEEIQYTVTEDHVEDYSTTIEGTTITNKYTPGKTSATVTKNWEDNNNQDGKRPKSIEVELLANGEPTGKTATLDVDNDWTHTWQDLDEKAKGKDIQYTVKETTNVKDYDTSINNDNIGNLIITNAYTPETTKVEGEKVWKDHDNQDGKRPDHLKVNLLKNGEEVDTQTVDASSNWTYAFHDLPKYEDGKTIHYSVTEDHVDDYTTTIDGTTITNTFTPGKTSATVTKHWDDQQDKNKQRPASIEVELLANGKPTGKTITLNDKNDWTYTWQDLDEKVKGKEIVYTVQERTQLEHYNVSVNNDDMGNLMITNQFKDPSTPVDPDKPNEEKPNKPKQPDTPSESPKTSEQPKPGIPKFISELPNTGKALMQSWITWVVIACIGLGIFFIFKRRK
ncbi:collagen adhesin [Staphylococcus agnetis]|uniref:Cna B-type domain-containing protein n=1 Tax=Staphylococcus agnetis TaxID=985762 RepID=UPI000E01DADE|nr:Cna B-type domain-containing protein [Staphylococcus agnetis]SUK13867.1 collagen adhesin [Staphylococcus agnetis]